MVNNYFYCFNYFLLFYRQMPCIFYVYKTSRNRCYLNMAGNISIFIPCIIIVCSSRFLGVLSDYEIGFLDPSSCKKNEFYDIVNINCQTCSQNTTNGEDGKRMEC